MPVFDRLAEPRAYDRIRPQIMDLETENIAELAVRAQSLTDVITLWYGEGDLVTPSFIREAAKEALDAGQTFYVPDMRGLPALTRELSSYLTRLHGREIAVERSTITPGGMQAVFLALELIVERGDNVVFVEPQWPNIKHAIHVAGGEPRPVSLDFRDGSWQLDLDRVFERCDARTKAIMFSTPSNPLGWTASPEELQALIDFSRRTGIWILSDEIYNRLHFSGDRAPSVLQLAEDEDLVISINGFSKAWAMTGWRLGWLTHPKSLASPLSAMTQYVNSGTAAFVQAGGLAALKEGETFVGEVRARCRAGVDAAYDALAGLNSVILPEKPEGGMYVTFALADEADSREACTRLLEEARVGLAPGWLFGDASKAFLRMCICRDTAQIAEAGGRIARMLGEPA
ncbi:pyridoxal phosphate-dependent aminotransferase [Amorphus orientalis]|uniref:Aminotransferase n=1 Tax=Amorphus orientalis TaxID=649198 RepID=A0AAE3VL44_9HYPH|nr:pyridoxal phosphate-dependent aminotransferase [Amorphus orientalis]MDQ0314027.1 aspartate/methionine/tyrosine aminotransferase [Amorphus orientalis]